MKAREKKVKFLSALIQRLSAKSSAVNFIKRVAARCLVIATIGSSFSCAPFSSDLQSARVVGKKGIEITPEYSSIQFAEEKKQVEEKGSQESKGRLIGLQVAYGMSKKVDLRVRVEHFEFRDFSAYVFSVGPKFSLVKDRVALYLPVWFVEFKPAQIQPTLLLTFPVVKNKVEFNPSVKNIISVGGYDPNSTFLVAFNAGLGISTDLSKWALRPEYSLVYNVKESCQYRSISIGLSLNMSLLFKK